MQPVLDLCRRARLPVRGEGFIQLKNVDKGRLCALDRDVESSLAVFENSDPTIDEVCVVEAEPLARLECGDVLVNETGDNVGQEEGIVSPKCLLFKESIFPLGVDERNGEVLSEWVINKLGDFGSFLGMSYEGFEDEVMGLFKRIEFWRRGLEFRVNGPDLVRDKRLRKELKRLESSMNYERIERTRSDGGGRKERGAIIVFHGS